MLPLTFKRSCGAPPGHPLAGGRAASQLARARASEPPLTRELLPLVRRALSERYTVDREIARGGAACVFLGYDAAGAAVALKVLRPELVVSVTSERFLREVAFLAQVSHPRIPKLLDWGESEWLVWYVMPYIAGPSLRDHLTRLQCVAIDDTLRIADELLDALSFAHQQGIVHRDVKPENIVLSEGGAILLDFGIARAIAEAGTDRLTRSGYAVGTSAYMSPEQVEGSADIDARSDLYSLGCVLFECLAGRPPFTAAREEAVLRMHLHCAPPDVRTLRKDAPRPLGRVIDRALKVKRKDRWRSAADMRQALQGD